MPHNIDLFSIPLKYTPIPAFVSSSKIKAASNPVVISHSTQQHVSERRQKMSDRDCAQIIYNQIKNASCYKKTESMLKRIINKDNVIGILSEYQHLSKGTSLNALPNAINRELFLDYETVKTVIINPLIRKATELKIDLRTLPNVDELINMPQANEYINILVDLIKNGSKLDNQQKLAKNLQTKYARPTFNENEYTLQSLKKQYPAPEYTVEENKEKDLIVVSKNNSLIKQVFKNKENHTFKIYEYNNNIKTKAIYVENNVITDINLYNSSGEKSSKKIEIEYGKNGKVSYLGTEENEYKFDAEGNLFNPDALVKDIKSIGLVSKIALKKINKDNICSVINWFEYKYKQDFFDFVKKNKNLSFEEKQNYLNKFQNLLMDALNYDKNYQSNIQISNDFYHGKSYKVKFNGYKAVITDVAKKTSVCIDLDKILSMGSRNKIDFAKTLQKLPGEILLILAKECNHLYDRNDDSEMFYKLGKLTTGFAYSKSFNSAGYATPLHNITAQNHKDTIVHELGHLIDYYMGGCKFSWNIKYRRTYEKEQDAYISKIGEEAQRAYHSESAGELFSEVVRGILTNDKSLCKQIRKDFPQSFDNAVKCYKEYISKLL